MIFLWSPESYCKRFEPSIAGSWLVGLPVSGHHAHKLAMPCRDLLKILFGGKLAIRKLVVDRINVDYLQGDMIASLSLTTMPVCRIAWIVMGGSVPFQKSQPRDIASFRVTGGPVVVRPCCKPRPHRHRRIAGTEFDDLDLSIGCLPICVVSSSGRQSTRPPSSEPGLPTFCLPRRQSLFQRLCARSCVPRRFALACGFQG